MPSHTRAILLARKLCVANALNTSDQFKHPQSVCDAIQLYQLIHCTHAVPAMPCMQWNGLIALHACTARVHVLHACMYCTTQWTTI